MKNNQRGLLVRHLLGGELDQAIAEAQKADETGLVRRLCYVKNLYAGDTREEAGDRVGIASDLCNVWMVKSRRLPVSRKIERRQ